MGAFQLPGVGFIFVHALSILPGPDDTGATVDAEGRWSSARGAPIPVQGYLSMNSRGNAAIAAANRVRIDAVAALPTGTAIDETCQLVAAGVSPLLDGTYNVTAVEPTAVHLRALLTRTPGLTEGSQT